MRSLRSTLACVLAVHGLALLPGCGGGSSGPAAPRLTAIAVTPSDGYVGFGRTVQLTATGTYSDGSTQDLSATVIWFSRNEAAATVSNAAGTAGQVTVVGQGPVAVVAKAGEISGVARFDATALVDTAEDAVAADGRCSLREALLNAAALDRSGSADCAAGVGQDVIRFDLPSPAVIALSSPLPDVVFQLTILGPGTDQLRISGGGAVRILRVAGRAALALRDLTLAQGWADEGGAIANDGGGVVAYRVLFADNGAGHRGGAIANRSGILGVHDSTFTGNSTAGDGGAVYTNGYPTAEVHRCVFAGNLASGGGGAIYNTDSLYITAGTFDQNASGAGGGALWNGLGGWLYVRTSTTPSPGTPPPPAPPSPTASRRARAGPPC